jgi:enoyl-CoA hydratase
MPVKLEMVEPGIACLRVNRPEVHNALGWDAMDRFAACVEQAHGDRSLRALVVTGTGKSFIAGGDLRELHDHASWQDGKRLSAVMTQALTRLERLPCPVIAAINGAARGGGVEIALACDLRVMAGDASLGLVQVTLGLSPGWGAGQRLLRLVGYARALELLATGRVVETQEAGSLGLVNRVTPPGQALAGALDLARSFTTHDPGAVAAVKRLLRAGVDLPPGAAAVAEQDEFPALWVTDAHQQAVTRFLERRRT